MRAFSAGDTSSFGQLIRRHQETVFKVVRRYARAADEARELTQRAFLQALEVFARKPLAEEVPFKAWVLRLAINLGKNHVRDAVKRDALGAAAESPRPLAALADEALEQAEAAALTRRAVLTLPPRQREVFTLRIDAGLPFAEVATTLGISEGNAKAHFHHAVKRLKEEVAKLSSPGGGP